jgi:pyruvate,water dikinase
MTTAADALNVVLLTKPLDEAVYGGKAAQLSVAARAGLPVPPGLALPARLVAAAAVRRPAAVAALTEAVRLLAFPVAVRSSAVGEDSEAASFAGQHLTRLNVRSISELIEAVSAVFASAHSESARRYRQRVGLGEEAEIGVVVQELVDADCAGVLFTRNPLDGADELVVEASWGLGESVVGGLVVPDRFRLGRDGTVLERTAGMKDIAVVSRAEGGTAEDSVPEKRRHALCLGEDELRSLHELAVRCEELFGGAQDLEWAFARSRLYLLQRRALTALPR